MAKKQKKHQPDAEEVPKPFYFLDRAKWVWTGYEWIIEDLGHWWFGNLTNRYYRFMHEIFDEFGGCNGWSTISHAEQMIFRCAKYPVFTVDPDPMFIRRWIDVWIELQYCRIWQHIFNTLRLNKGVDEVDAKQRADTLASRFEALYHPTSPRRLPQVMKTRRGSKRAKMSDNAEMEQPSEPTSVPIDAADLDRGLELHGPHPSPMLSYERCYRVLDRGDPEPAKYGPSSRAGFYDGARVVALVAGNGMDELKIAAMAAFHELKRIRVYERMKNAEVVVAETFVSDVEILTGAVVSQSGSMYTIQCPTKPTLAEAAQILGINEAELDSQFGVCLIDPEAGQYTVMVVGNPETTGGEGPSSNPQIGIFGPPEAGVDTAGDDKV